MSVPERLKQSYTALKEYFSLSKRQDSVGNPAQLVVFAEHAVKNGYRDIAVECIQLYFSLSPPVNQFQVRAHLCEALALSPHNSSQEELLSHSLSCILKAVADAKKAECYHFLVYNASVLLWQICRPFQRPGSRRLYSRSLQTVVKALEEIKDQDTSWRVQLMIALVLSQLDGGQSEEAAKTCSSALTLARKKAPEKIPEILRLHVSYNLGDCKVFDKDTKTSPEYYALVRLYKVKSAMVHQKLSGSELEQKLQKVFTFITNGEEPSSSGRKTATLSGTPAPPPETRPPLLLEVGSLAIENGLVSLAEKCLNATPPESVGHSVQLSVRRQVLSCQVMVREGYSKSAVEGRVQAVKRLDDILVSTLRTKDMDLIQHVCVALWNISLPLLQPNLRHHLLKPLLATASALEQIDSLLNEMRVGAHFELGKIYADQDQLEASLEHLDKALGLDCMGEHREKISVVQNKVALRAQLYTTPEDPLQRAIKIIEQAGSISGGDSDELRSLLIKAGELLAPDKFSQTLTRPSQSPSSGLASQTSGGTLSHDTRAAIEEKGRRMASYSLAKEMVAEHLKVMDKQADKQRCHVWEDLARTARKQGVWDVATAAAQFCVAYDDGRWACSVPKSESVVSERLSSPRLNQRSSMTLPHRTSSSLLQKTDSQTTVSKSQSVGMASAVSSVMAVKREECDLIRTLANTHCLLAECLVFYLQQEGLSLGEQPASLDSPPALHEAWNAYTTWVTQLSADSVAGFLRGAELGVALKKAGLVASAAAYLWNYHLHWVKSGHLTQVVGVFKPLLASMRLVDMSSDSVLLTQVCSALVSGVVQKWTPKPTAGSSRAATGVGKKGATGRAESRAAKKVKGGDDQVQVDPDSGPELKEALEVCEYCIGVWGGVPLSVRGGLLNAWVACRQLLHQPFTNKNYDIEEAGDPCAIQCRAMVAVGVVSAQGNGIWDFPNCPTLTEVSSMVSECEWGEELVEMEVWVRLAELALRNKEDSLAYQCAGKAVALKLPNTTSEKLSSNGRGGCELVSLAHSLQGQALSASAAGNVAVLRRALEAFHQCARFGHKASSYCLVFEGCRHYWLTCQPLTSDPMERGLLQEPLCDLLDLCVPLLGGRHGGKTEDQTLVSRRKADYELVTHMYSAVFQAYVDKASWEEGLALVEDALWNTPKPIHPHLVSYKLIFKSRMGKSVEGDLIRFQEEPSEFVAALWHKTAINSSDPTHTIKAYQNAIDSLQPGDAWQKVEYLLEFCEWLYSNHFPVSDPINQLENITEILTNTAENESDDGQLEGSFIVTGVRQLEVLMRVHVMMALLHGRGSSEHARLSVVAVGLCLEMWKLLVGGTGLPGTVLEWSTYTISAQLLEQLKSGSGGDKGVNLETVTKPMLTLHYLSELVECLAFSGLHPLALPVLKLQLVIAESLAQNKSLLQLHHIRLSSVCLELGLDSSPSPLAPLPDPEDLATSLVEIEQYKAKKAAVEKEGSKRSLSSKQSPNKSIKRKSTTLFSGAEKKTSTSVSGKGSVKHFIEEKVVVREVWVNMALLLIQQGDYQWARDLLNQAMLSSQAFDDQHTMFQILVSLARLALTEKNQQRAIKLLTQAQTCPSSLSDWVEGMLLLSDAISSSSDYRNQLRPVLEHALSTVDKLRSSDQNNTGRLEHAQTIIKARLALCELGECVEGGSEARASLRALSDSLTDTSKILMDLGCYRDAACISTQHASFLRCVALSKQAKSEDQFKEWLLEAISLCDRAVCALQSICEHAIQVCQPSEEVSLPVQRELVQAQALLADLLLDAFSHHYSQHRRARNEMKDKTSVEKLIDDFVREEPSLSLMEQEWEDINQMGLERALALLTSAHASAHKNHTLNTKVLVGLGRCLNLLSTHKRPDSALQWSDEYCIVATSNDLPSNQKGENPDIEGNPPAALSGAKYGALSSVMRMKEAKTAENDECSSLRYLSQASQMLVQAVSTSISTRQPALGMQAALELVDYYGGFDSTMASLYLALYQSLSVSVELDRLVRQVLADPSGSKLGALLEQNAHLSSFQSPSLQNNLDQLLGFQACKMMTVTENHLDLLRQFPSNFRFIVFQHSSDSCRLYASYLVPPQPPPPVPKKGQPPPPVECLDPVISCAAVSPKELYSVLDMMKDFQRSNYQKLVKTNMREADNEGLLKDIIAATESYLSPVLKQIMEALQREKTDRELSFIILADPSLFRLPLEALDIFQTKIIHSVTRDFSIQLLCHRMDKFSADDSIPAMESTKDTKKKGDKFQPQPTSLLANINSFKYVLDPRKEFSETGPCSEVVSQIQTFSKLTSKWSGYNAGEQVMSVSDWTSLLKEASGLIYFGTENLLAHLPLTNLAPLSLHECSIAVIMDRVHTTQSILHQSKLDFFKSCFELECERPVETAMFLSAVGVRCVLSNQWTASLQANLDKTINTLKGLLSEGSLVGVLNWTPIRKSFMPDQDEPASDSKTKLDGTQEEAVDPTQNSQNTSVDAAAIELCSTFNSVVYGLPHINLIAPTM